MWKSDRREGETLLLYFFCSTRKNFWEKFAINFTRSSNSFMNILTYSLAIFSIVVPSFTINFVSLFRLDLYFPLRFNFLLLRDFKHRNAVFINWLFIQIIKCKAIGCILMAFLTRIYIAYYFSYLQFIKPFKTTRNREGIHYLCRSSLTSSSTSSPDILLYYSTPFTLLFFSSIQFFYHTHKIIMLRDF